MDRNQRRVPDCGIFAVALRKESVDRNFGRFSACFPSLSSLSARRAWIEMNVHLTVAAHVGGRSPQGERG